MKYKGSPLLGDNQYGKKNMKFKNINKDFSDYLSILSGQALHAKSLGFIHPNKNKRVIFDSQLPFDFNKLLNNFEILLSLAEISMFFLLFIVEFILLIVNVNHI